MSSTYTRPATRVAGAQPDTTHMSDEDPVAGQQAALAVLFERDKRRIFRFGPNHQAGPRHRNRNMPKPRAAFEESGGR
jgi:hypothetical protein